MSSEMRIPGFPPKQGLYDPRFEKDSCGIGFVANIKGVKSHDIVRKGLQVLTNLFHRGAQGCDPCTGDGAGILLQVPHGSFTRGCADVGVKLPNAGEYGVGRVSLPRNAAQRKPCERLFEKVIAEEGARLLGWRDVPVKSGAIGSQARQTEPAIRQVFIARDILNEAQFERKLYVIRKRIENAIPESAIEGREHFYIPSISMNTIIYKGLLLPDQITQYYPDLTDTSVVSALAMIHSRFSTNTFPTWPLAHPYRYICHNGEINTLKGNVNWMRARQGRLQSELFGDDIPKLFPIVYEHQSDSACIDNALEFLVMGGRSLAQAMMMLIPEPWVGNPQMDLDRRGFYEYHAAMMEPWDGPAAVCFTDGKQIGATLDRNGLRPCRYQVTTDDLAVLSDRPQLLFKYFKQLFAQVTNPPIDPIREELVMSLVTNIGPKPNVMAETPEACRRIKVQQPILTNADLEKIRQIADPHFKGKTLRLLFRVAEGPDGLGAAVDDLCQQASQAIKDGYKFLILSDRGVNEEWAPIPSLLGISAVHHHLVRECSRTEVGLILETGEPRDVHHFAGLIGYGAGTINPYLVFETLVDMERDGYLPEGLDAATAQAKFIKAINKGLLKIFSKMGISTVQSYCGAQIFEAIGLNHELVDRYFTGTASRIEGIGIRAIGEETLRRHKLAYEPAPIRQLDFGGEVHYRVQGEHHNWNPETIYKLQHATHSNDPKTYKEFAALVNDESKRRSNIRGLLEIKTLPQPIPLEEVEPAKEIIKRFTTGAMSFGAISKEAHETLAVAMNRIGGKSNTGEGGEDPGRFVPLPNGDSKNSAIKQVASARFGVTTDYLVHAKELQIKMAQGAKPGEGGQLPGHKVDETIAKLRYATPGVQLISLPPHHDIYSIEDRARRRDRRVARRRRVRLLHGPADRRRLHHDAQVPPQHLPGGDRHPRPRAPRQVHWPAGARRELLLLRGRGGTRVDGEDGVPEVHRDDRPHRQAPGPEGDRPLEGEGLGPLRDPCPTSGRTGRRPVLCREAGPRAGPGHRLEAHRAVQGGDRTQNAGAARPPHPQREPDRRDDPLQRDRQALPAGRGAARHPSPQVHGLGRAGGRRLPRPRRDAGARRRVPRLTR